MEGNRCERRKPDNPSYGYQLVSHVCLVLFLYGLKNSISDSEEVNIKLESSSPAPLLNRPRTQEGKDLGP